MNVAPVELDNVTTTLVEFNCRTSAAELVAIKKLVAGELIEIVSAVLKLSGAAKAAVDAK